MGDQNKMSMSPNKIEHAAITVGGLLEVEGKDLLLKTQQT